MTAAELDPPPNLVFYHTIEFGPGRVTPGWPVIIPIVDMMIDAMRSVDFAGKRVLDIGCRDGAMSFAAEKLGAAEIMGIDADLPTENLAFLTRALNSQARFESRNVFDVKPETYGLFDVILLAGVVYHLRYPFSGLRVVRDLLRDGGNPACRDRHFYGRQPIATVTLPDRSGKPVWGIDILHVFQHQGIQ